MPDGKYIYVEYTTQQNNVATKIEKDIEKCLDVNITGIPIDRIKEIICITLIIVAVIIAVIGCAAYCCVNAKCWNSNFVSMISGLWSAVATLAVGIIAYWQNRQYKKLSDRMDDRVNAPEFYVPSFRSDMPNTMRVTFNRLNVVGKENKGFQSNGVLKFASLDKPILNLRPVEIFIDGEKEDFSIKEVDGIDIYISHDLFVIDIQHFKHRKLRNHSIQIVFQFENIYGTKYRKTTSLIYL